MTAEKRRQSFERKRLNAVDFTVIQIFNFQGQADFGQIESRRGLRDVGVNVSFFQLEMQRIDHNGKFNAHFRRLGLAELQCR